MLAHFPFFVCHNSFRLSRNNFNYNVLALKRKLQREQIQAYWLQKLHHEISDAIWWEAFKISKPNILMSWKFWVSKPTTKYRRRLKIEKLDSIKLEYWYMANISEICLFLFVASSWLQSAIKMKWSLVYSTDCDGYTEDISETSC